MRRTVLSLLLVLFFVSCKSIPIPESDSDKLFVIVLGTKDKTKEGNGKGSEKIIIENKKIDFRKSYTIKGEGYIFLENLQPGRYQILNYNNIRPSSFTSFIIREDSKNVTIFRSRINLLYYDGSYGNSIGSESMSEDEISKVSGDIINQYPEMSNWNW